MKLFYNWTTGTWYWLRCSQKPELNRLVCSNNLDSNTISTAEFKVHTTCNRLHCMQARRSKDVKYNVHRLFLFIWSETLYRNRHVYFACVFYINAFLHPRRLLITIHLTCIIYPYMYFQSIFVTQYICFL